MPAKKKNTSKLAWLKPYLNLKSRSFQLIIFVLVFGSFGAYALIRSFAATTTVTYKGSLTAAKPADTYTITTGTGALSFSLWNPPPHMSVTVSRVNSGTAPTELIRRTYVNHTVAGSINVMPGTYTVKVSYDYTAFGRNGRPYALTITYPLADTTKPVAVITSPTNTDVSKTIAFNATATDDTGITRVEFYADDQLLGTDSDSPYSYNLDTLKLASGTHTLKVKSYDGSGNVGEASLTVNVNNATVSTKLVPSNIAADCSVDVTKALMSWMASIPDNNTLQFKPAACYRVDGVFAITNRNGLTIDGQGATFMHVTNGSELGSRDARTRSMFKVTGGSNITIKNTIVQGGNPNAGIGDAAYVEALEAQHAYEFLGVKTALAENVQGYKTYGDFVYIGNNSNNITVHGSHFEKSGRQGVSVTSGTDIIIDNNYFGDIRRSLFDIEANSSTAVIKRVTFQRNTVGPVRLTFFANQGSDATIEDVTIAENQVTDTDMDIVSVAYGSVKRKNYKILNNVGTKGFGNPQGHVFRLIGIDGVEVRGNTVPLQSGRNMKLVGLADTHNVRITDNKAPNAVGVVMAVNSNTNISYCQSNNQIGTPLVAAPVDKTCPAL